MGFRFRKSVKLMPGVRLNLGKRGSSLSVGRKGATINISKRGTRTTLGLPGTGLSHTSYSSNKKSRVKSRSSGSSGLGWIIILAIVGFFIVRAFP